MRVRALFLLFIAFSWPARAVEVKEVVSPGGIRAWLVEEHSQPLIALHVTFGDAGSATDPKGKEGRAALAGQLLLEGAGDMNALAFTKALETHAIQFSLRTDADFTFAALTTLSEQREEAFHLLGLALTQPRFDAESIERLRRRSLVALTQLAQNPSWQLGRAWRMAAFANHPYAKGAEGTAVGLKTLKQSDFTRFSQHYLTKENLTLSVAGDITAEELAARLDSIFGALPDRFAPEGKIADVTLPAQPRTLLVDQDIPQTLVTFGLTGIKREDPDYIPAYILNTIIGGTALSARLGKEVREKRGLAYSISTGLDPMLHAPVWKGSFSTRNDQAASAVQVVRDTLADIAQNGVSDAELEDAKYYVTGSFVLSLDSNADVAAFLINMQLYKLGKDYLDKRNALMNAVTQADLKRVAARFLKPENLLVVMAGRPQNLKAEKAP